MMEMTKNIDFQGIRDCGHIVSASVPRLESTTREDFDKALVRVMKKPCKECK